MRISDWSSDVCSSDLAFGDPGSVAPFNMEALLIGIAEAERSIQLCTPYFIPSDELSTALQLAAASGVKVELMLPAQSDSFFVQHASFSFLKPLLAQIERAHVCTPVTNAQLVCRLQLETQNT